MSATPESTPRLDPDSEPSAERNKYVAWVPTPLHPVALERARELFDVIEGRGASSNSCDRSNPLDSRSDTWERVADCAIVTSGKLARDRVERSGRLRIVTRNGVGVDSVPLDACRQKGVCVTNQPGCNAKAVAEVALGLAISVSRRLCEIDRTLRSSRGRTTTTTAVEWSSPGLDRKTVGLVGMGDTARETAKKFTGAFECDIVVYSPTSSRLKWTDRDPTSGGGGSGGAIIRHRRVDTLDELLETSDVVSLHCPLNDDTRGIVGKRELGIMKRSAIILNTARGGLIDEVALADALETNEIRGAGIDTLEHEPPTLERYPKLLSLDNAVVLPHVGAQEEESSLRNCLVAVETAHSFLTGRGIGESTRVV
ncbi:hypothetical protein JCM3766R1_000280 [Sporobolomyces carnicolor]